MEQPYRAPPTTRPVVDVSEVTDPLGAGRGVAAALLAVGIGLSLVPLSVGADLRAWPRRPDLRARDVARALRRTSAGRRRAAPRGRGCRGPRPLAAGRGGAPPQPRRRTHPSAPIARPLPRCERPLVPRRAPRRRRAGLLRPGARRLPGPPGRRRRVRPDGPRARAPRPARRPRRGGRRRAQDAPSAGHDRPEPPRGARPIRGLVGFGRRARRGRRRLAAAPTGGRRGRVIGPQRGRRERGGGRGRAPPRRRPRARDDARPTDRAREPSARGRDPRRPLPLAPRALRPFGAAGGRVGGVVHARDRAGNRAPRDVARHPHPSSGGIA